MNRIRAIVKKGIAAMSGMALAGLAITLFTVGGMPTDAQASVALDPDGNIKMFGDVRFRVEADNRTAEGATTDEGRHRFRYRARFGTSFKANDEWSGKIRLATTSGQNSPHVNFSTAGNTSDLSIGVDQAYVAFTGVENLTLVGGKTPLPFWQQTEVFWDTDLNPEAIGAVYNTGPLTLNLAWASVTASGWSSEQPLYSYQVVYNGDMGGLDLTAAVGGATVDSGGLGLNANSHAALSVQVKGSGWRVGGEYIASDAQTDDTAFVVQARYKLTDTVGVRAYYYSVETFATLGDGAFTQDNFGSSNSSADNFDGIRLQLDYKSGDNSSIDVRYYTAEKNNSAILDGQAEEFDRVQVNFNVKF